MLAPSPPPQARASLPASVRWWWWVQEGGGDLVRVLSVPDACQPGDPVYLEGGQPAGEWPKQCKSDKWKDVVAGLAVAGGVARYQATPLVTAAGPLTVAADMPDGAGIH